MAPDNLSEFYQRYVRAANARDFATIAELVHDEVTINGVPYQRAAVLASLQAITEAVPDFAWQVEDLLTSQDRIAARLRDTGTPTQPWLGLRPTGAAVDFTEFAHYKVRDGRFAEMWFLLDIAAVAAQLGQ